MPTKERATGSTKTAFQSKPPGTLRRRLIQQVALYGNRLLVALVLIAVWTAAVEFGLVDKFFVSTPKEIGAYLVMSFKAELLPHALDTLLATLIAFALSTVGGVFGGLVLVECARTKRIIDPFLTAVNSLPRIALAPIFILWFGIGVTSKVALAFSLGFFIVLTSTVAGIRNIDPALIRLSRSLGCTAWQQFLRITFPWAVPSVFGGLKLALIYSFLGVVTSEMLAAKTGLGQLIMNYSGLLRMDAVLGILVVLATCSVVLTTIADKIEGVLLGSWTEPTQSAHI